MNRKALGLSMIGLGLLLLASALFIKWYEVYSEERMLLEIEQRVRNSVFVVEQEKAAEDDFGVVNEELLMDEISSVDQDQEVAEVKAFKNVLDIPKIECQAYIGNGTTDYNLARGVGRHSETVEVGAVGNCVIAGHASVSFKCIFNRLEEMQVLDEFDAYDAEGIKHTYTIVKRFVCSPGQLSILDNTDDGLSTMTIYTCTEGGTMRFVLVGKEFDEAGLNDFKETYFTGHISRMRTLNSNMIVEPVSSLLDMRDTHRSYAEASESNIQLRPWVNDDARYSDAGVLNFGIVLSKKEEFIDDATQNQADTSGGEAADDGEGA